MTDMTRTTIEPAPPEPQDRIGMFRLLVEEHDIPRIGNPGYDLFPIGGLGEALGYSDAALRNLVSSDWRARLTRENWSSASTSTHEFDRRVQDAANRNIHIIKITGELLRQVKALFNRASQTFAVAKRTSSMLFATRPGVHFICGHLSEQPLAVEFQEFLSREGRIALETGTALTHDVSGNELPPPDSAELLVARIDDFVSRQLTMFGPSRAALEMQLKARRVLQNARREDRLQRESEAKLERARAERLRAQERMLKTLTAVNDIPPEIRAALLADLAKGA